MYFSRFLSRQPQRVAIRRFLASPTSPAPATSPAVRENMDRLLAASTQHNLVRDAITKMMAIENDAELKPIHDEELATRFKHFKQYYNEAESCIGDLREAGENVEEEIQCANGAVDNCFNSFIDLLEDLRRADEKQLMNYNDIRLENALSLRKLRQDLDVIMHTADKEIS